MKEGDEVAKYAISKEGVEALNQLANELLINANNIVEINQKLEQITSSLYDNLGIYGDEIISIIHQNRNTLNSNREDIVLLSQRVKTQASDIEEMISDDFGANTPNNYNQKNVGLFGTLTSFLSGQHFSKGRYEDINSIPEKEFRLIETYVKDGSAINTSIRNGQETKEIKSLKKCINEHVLPEDMTLVRAGGKADFNSQELYDCSLDDLVGKKVCFSGFMSTSPNKKVCENNNNRKDYEFEFIVKAGTQGLDLSNLPYNEVIFNDKVEYVIEQAYVIGNNTKHIVARIL